MRHRPANEGKDEKKSRQMDALDLAMRREAVIDRKMDNIQEPLETIPFLKKPPLIRQDSSPTQVKLAIFFYDAFEVVLSLSDMFSDVIIIYHYWELQDWNFLYAGGGMLFIAQCIYAIWFTSMIKWQDDSVFSMPVNVMVFCTILPISQLMPVFFWAFESGYNFPLRVLKVFNMKMRSDPVGRRRAKGDHSYRAYFQDILETHIGFIIESIVESFPQACVQITYMVVHPEAQLHWISVMSILLSMGSFLSKVFMMSSNLCIHMATIWIMTLCASIDVFNMFLSLAFLFVHQEGGYTLWVFDEAFQLSGFSYIWWNMLLFVFFAGYTTFLTICFLERRQIMRKPWKEILGILIGGIFGPPLIAIPLLTVLMFVRWTLLGMFIMSGIVDMEPLNKNSSSMLQLLEYVKNLNFDEPTTEGQMSSLQKLALINRVAITCSLDQQLANFKRVSTLKDQRALAAPRNWEWKGSACLTELSMCDGRFPKHPISNNGLWHDVINAEAYSKLYENSSRVARGEYFTREELSAVRGGEPEWRKMLRNTKLIFKWRELFVTVRNLDLNNVGWVDMNMLLRYTNRATAIQLAKIWTAFLAVMAFTFGNIFLYTAFFPYMSTVRALWSGDPTLLQQTFCCISFMLTICMFALVPESLRIADTKMLVPYRQIRYHTQHTNLYDNVVSAIEAYEATMGARQVLNEVCNIPLALASLICEYGSNEYDGQSCRIVEAMTSTRGRENFTKLQDISSKWQAAGCPAKGGPLACTQRHINATHFHMCKCPFPCN